MTSNRPSKPIRERLLQAAQDCFLNDEYHKVSTRRIAEQAGANISMIRYYFGSKEGLFEEMTREILQPLLDALDETDVTTTTAAGEFLRLYYRCMTKQPAFPKLLLKVLALNQGPGRRFILQLLERGRRLGADKTRQIQAELVGKSNLPLDPDLLRLVFVSLAVTPMLLKDIFEQQMGCAMGEEFLDRLAEFGGGLLSASLTSPVTGANSS